MQNNLSQIHSKPVSVSPSKKIEVPKQLVDLTDEDKLALASRKQSILLFKKAMESHKNEDEEIL